MSDERKQPDVSQRLKKSLERFSQPLKRALSHLGRLELFIFLADRADGKPTSEQELAEVFGMSIRLVEYHLKVLEDAELVANVADGATEPAPSCYIAAATL